jgi:hypothetical protein
VYTYFLKISNIITHSSYLTTTTQYIYNCFCATFPPWIHCVCLAIDWVWRSTMLWCTRPIHGDRKTPISERGSYFALNVSTVFGNRFHNPHRGNTLKANRVPLIKPVVMMVQAFQYFVIFIMRTPRIFIQCFLSVALIQSP